MSLSRRKWISIPTISIPWAGPAVDPATETSFIGYKLLVKDGTSSWTLLTRYSRLYDLANKLQSRYPDVKFAPFPPKTAFWEDDTSPAFVEKRRLLLEIWFQRVLAEAKLLQSGEVRGFLDPAGSVDKSTLTSSTSGLDSRRYDPTVFLLPAPPSMVRLPEVLEYQGETYFIAPLISEIRDNLEILVVLKKALEEAAPIERLDILDRCRERATAVVSLLKDEGKVLLKLLQSSFVASNPPLYEWFDSCASQTQKAVEWYEELETLVVERLTAEGETGEKVKLEQRMKIYEEMIEAHLAESFNCSTPQQITEVESKLKDVLESILQDQALAASVMEVESCAEKLGQLREFAESNLRAINQYREMSPDDRIASLEARMFSILDSVSSLEGTPEDPSRNTEIHSKVTKLIKDLGMFRNMLLEKLELEDGGDKGNLRHLLNRAEDLQENLVDLEHNFISKHPIDKGFGGMALDMLKERVVSQARREHAESESDLFEL